jgi:hypothetical protein
LRQAIGGAGVSTCATDYESDRIGRPVSGFRLPASGFRLPASLDLTSTSNF